MPVACPPPNRTSRLRLRLPRLGRDGTTSLEFALVGPVLVFLVVMIVELSWQLTTDLALNLGAIIGSRYGTIGSGADANGSRDASVRNAVISIAGGVLQSSQLTLTDQNYANAQAYATGGSSTGGSGATGTFVVYSLSYQQPFLTGIPSLFLSGTSITHTTTVVVQNEPF